MTKSMFTVEDESGAVVNRLPFSDFAKPGQDETAARAAARLSAFKKKGDWERNAGLEGLVVRER